MTKTLSVGKLGEGRSTRGVRRFLIDAAKIAISLAIVAYLAVTVARDEEVSRLWSQPKNWPLFAAAWFACFTAVIITFLRWWLLVRALGLRFGFADAIRLGFLGFLFNFVSLGSVGGDLFKAIAIAREQPEKKTQAISSVVVDRFLGLYGLLAVAVMAMMLADLRFAQTEVRLLYRLTLVAGGMAVVGGVLFFLPGFSKLPLAKFLTGLPKVGTMFAELLAAFQQYRRSRKSLAAAILMGMSVHACFALGFYLIAHALFDPAPSLATNFVVVPLGMVAGALPLPLGALGAFDYAISVLYVAVTETGTFSQAQGILVAVGYRVICVLIAIVGVICWIVSRNSARAKFSTRQENAADTVTGAPGGSPSGASTYPIR